MNRDTRNQLIRLSVDTELSEEFRLACRKELGDVIDFVGIAVVRDEALPPDVAVVKP